MSESLQRETAVLFARLAQRGGCGPGTLSLCCGLGEMAVPLAVMGLGGACLVLTEDAAAARAANRAGVTDFTVDTLGESLRILKNEVRKRQPVSVAVVGAVAANVDAMLHRGVQPQRVFGEAAMGHGFVERGASAWDRSAPAGEGAWELRQCVAASAVARRDADRVLLEGLPREDAEHPTDPRALWLRTAPRLFPRDRDRWYWTPRSNGRKESQDGA